MLHNFQEAVDVLHLPSRFTFPFHYTPHPLCCRAAEEVKAYIASRPEWEHELKTGKMFGVLVVQHSDGRIGYLSAYSGILAQRNDHEFFVPAVFNMISPGSYFKREEARISQINVRIKSLQNNSDYVRLQNELNDLKSAAEVKLKAAKDEVKRAKLSRELKREQQITPEEATLLVRESQFQKAELKRLERFLKDEIQEAEKALVIFEEELKVLRQERKSSSAALQKWLFDQFEMLNALGEKRSLSDIFAETVQKTPPAGAGECAGPKLLQYAYQNGLKPLAMAEFWWGDSPKTELRIHEHYYPACKGKCQPILQHMMIGLEVDPDPMLLHNGGAAFSPEIIFEDDWILIVDKPAGVLSVPGKLPTESVYSWAHQNYPQATGPMVVHRLDMATSGLLLIAKTKEVHQKLQAMFASRDIRKRYIALLEGVLSQKQGEIHLPLCLDPMDRPRQMVNYEFGKPAHTIFEVLSVSGGRTRVAMYPLTGRTHQLRVHAAHCNGLNMPICGDNLYGISSDRLYLHAEQLIFKHPVTGVTIAVEAKTPF
ncbi:MAG: pseudouridine synthase [Bacteroidales bacterium]